MTDVKQPAAEKGPTDKVQTVLLVAKWARDGLAKLAEENGRTKRGQFEYLIGQEILRRKRAEGGGEEATRT